MIRLECKTTEYNTFPKEVNENTNFQIHKDSVVISCYDFEMEEIFTTEISREDAITLAKLILL